MNETANTGFIVKATNIDATKATIKVIGIYSINLPIIPGQKIRGKKGAIVVRVPAKTGAATSAVPILAASFIVKFFVL